MTDLWQRVKARQREARIEMGKGRIGQTPSTGFRRRKFPVERAAGLRAMQWPGTRSWARIATAAPRRRRQGHLRQTFIPSPDRESRRVSWGGLKDKLMAPELIAEFIRAYQAEINDAAKGSGQPAAEN